MNSKMFAPGYIAITVTLLSFATRSVVHGQGTASPVSTPTQPDDSTVQTMLNSFNTARQSVDPPAATPIPNLTYRDEVETSACSYASQCKFDPTTSFPQAQHSTSAQRTITYGQPNTVLGENLYWSYRQGTTCAAGSAAQALTASVTAWNDEKQYYQVGCPQTNSQNVVGHYSQNIWSSTTGVGCCAQCCNVKTSNGVDYAVQLVVCQFAPA